jgi:Type II secretion system (T2SS), protein M subtype b
MTLSPGFRRMLAWTVVSGVIALIGSYWESSSPSMVAMAGTDSIAMAEKQLAKLRNAAATVPQKQEILKQVSGDLALREKGIINADTAPQAQAQIIQILRKLGHDESPEVEIRQEFGAVRPLGDIYGEVLVSVQIECAIEQLVNILVGLAARPELIASNEVRITSSNAKNKTIGVRLTVSGVVPRKLVPGKKGPGAS